MRPALSLPAILLLACCSVAGQWSKPDTTPSQAARDLSDCRHDAELANRRDSNIDTDILATRGQDWERLGVLSTKRTDFAESNSARSGDSVSRCMITKGYTSG